MLQVISSEWSRTMNKEQNRRMNKSDSGTLHLENANALICYPVLPDFVTGLITQPSFVAYMIAKLSNNAKSACTGRIQHWVAGFTSTGVTVMTIMSPAIEKFFALH